jgi:hypothetical protein
MKRKSLTLISLLAVLVGAGSCRSRTDLSTAPVILEFGQIGPVPIGVSVAAADTAGGVFIPTFTLMSVVKEPGATTSALEDVQITSYQVTYKRLDTGTRVPPPLVAAITQEVPVGAVGTITNLPILCLDQLGNPPLSDLLLFGHDTETGTAVIVLNVQIQFFGNTLSGDAIASPVAAYTIEFTP